jgi:hypothetical protein
MAASKLFTYGPDNVDSLLATTKSVLLNMGDFLEDQIFTFIPLLNFLDQKAKKMKQGGASILVPLQYGKNDTFQWYSGYDILDTTPQEGLTVAQAKWKNAACSITIAGDEERANTGEGQMYSLIKAKTEQAMLSMRDGIDQALFASTQVAKNIQCLPVLVDATSTVFDINSTTNSWWQSQVATGGSFSGQGLADFLNMYHLIQQQGIDGSAPDFIVTTQAILEYFERSQEPQRRYVGNEKLADVGFENLKYKGATVTFDPNCASGYAYFLSSKNLAFVVHSAANFKVGDFKKPTNQDAKTAQIIFTGNLVTNNRRKLGQINTISA